MPKYAPSMSAGGPWGSKSQHSTETTAQSTRQQGVKGRNRGTHCLGARIWESRCHCNADSTRSRWPCARCQTGPRAARAVPGSTRGGTAQNQPPGTFRAARTRTRTRTDTDTRGTSARGCASVRKTVGAGSRGTQVTHHGVQALGGQDVPGVDQAVQQLSCGVHHFLLLL